MRFFYHTYDSTCVDTVTSPGTLLRLTLPVTVTQLFCTVVLNYNYFYSETPFEIVIMKIVVVDETDGNEIVDKVHPLSDCPLVSSQIKTNLKSKMKVNNNNNKLFFIWVLKTKQSLGGKVQKLRTVSIDPLLT